MTDRLENNARLDELNTAIDGALQAKSDTVDANHASHVRDCLPHFAEQLKRPEHFGNILIRYRNGSIDAEEAMRELFALRVSKQAAKQVTKPTPTQTVGNRTRAQETRESPAFVTENTAPTNTETARQVSETP